MAWVRYPEWNNKGDPPVRVLFNKMKKIIVTAVNTIRYLAIVAIVVIISTLLMSEALKWPFNYLVAMGISITYLMFLYALYEITTVYIQENFRKA